MIRAFKMMIAEARLWLRERRIAVQERLWLGDRRIAAQERAGRNEAVDLGPEAIAVDSNGVPYYCATQAYDWRAAPPAYVRHAVDQLVDDPIPMILHCPACHAQHIDAPEAPKVLCRKTPRCDEPCGEACGDSGWQNPPHRSHLCHNCGFIWRPADCCTVGVAAIRSEGQNDTDPDDWSVCRDEAESYLAEAVPQWFAKCGLPDIDVNTLSQQVVLWARADPVARKAALRVLGAALENYRPAKRALFKSKGAGIEYRYVMHSYSYYSGQEFVTLECIDDTKRSRLITLAADGFSREFHPISRVDERDFSDVVNSAFFKGDKT